MHNKHVIIIGSGIGGLCCGIRLLHSGYKVSIYEKENTAGGVVKSLNTNVDSLFFDSFASIGIHPNEYRKIFEDVNLNPEDYFDSTNLDTLYKVFYNDGSSFELIKNYQKNSTNFEEFFNESIKNYTSLINKLYKKYYIADEKFLTKPFIKLNQIINTEVFSNAVKLQPLLSASKYIKKNIKSKKLQELLLFQTFYMGLDPRKLSNIYATVPAATQELGLLHINGGMGAYIDALKNAYTHLGGLIYYNQNISRIIVNNSTATGIVINNKEIYTDIIISNADYNYTINNLLLQKTQNSLFDAKQTKSNMSCSVFMLRIIISIKLPMLFTHNIYIDENFEEELSAVTKGDLPETPPMYIYYPASVDKNFTNKNQTTVNIMVRVPNCSFKNIHWNKDTIDKLSDICLRGLSKITNISDIENYIIFKSISTPNNLKNDYNCYQGAAFGIAPSLSKSIFFRPQCKSKNIENMYFVGSSIHPGNGISIVMKGAKITTDEIKNNLPLYS